MTTLELIRKLIELPPDTEVLVQRSGQRREMQVVATIRQDIPVSRQEPRPAVTLLTEWTEKP